MCGSRVPRRFRFGPFSRRIDILGEWGWVGYFLGVWMMDQVLMKGIGWSRFYVLVLVVFIIVFEFK
jgi:hypothetical protein